MVVVADTSPLNYLVLIDAANVLQTFYERICVPEAVIVELRSADAPLMVRQWAASLPAWVEVRGVVCESAGDPRWRALHRGEQATLQLAKLLKADLILIDERAGTRLARQSGFGVTGTLGVLDEAGRQGLLDLAAAIDKLNTTTFRYPKSLVDELLSEHAQPKPTPRE